MQTKFKVKETEECWIEIAEVINLEQGHRILDEQSGVRLYFIPKYVVVTRDKLFGYRSQDCTLDFEEAYEKYPWFFVN